MPIIYSWLDVKRRHYIRQYKSLRFEHAPMFFYYISLAVLIKGNFDSVATDQKEITLKRRSVQFNRKYRYVNFEAQKRVQNSLLDKVV